MTSSHKYIDHTADIAVELTADSFEELIVESLKAYNESVFESIDERNDESLDIKLIERSREELLVSFLNEVNYLLTAKKWITKSMDDLLIKCEDSLYILTGKLNGSSLTNEIELKEEIKSVTYHQMEVKELNGKLYTMIVLDI